MFKLHLKPLSITLDIAAIKLTYLINQLLPHIFLISFITYPTFANAKLAQGNINTQNSFMIADFIEYNEKENFIYAKGNIRITLDKYFLAADSLVYDIDRDILWAEGNIKIKDGNNKVILGERVLLKDKLKIGVISDFILSFGDKTLLTSKLAQKVEQNKIYLYKSNFTPCKIICNQKPIWQIAAKNTEVDFNKNTIIYKHVFFEIYGVPVLYLPYFSHPTPLAKAKSGILIPNIKNKSLGIPLYLRAKPNMDFTLIPRISTDYQIYELEARYKHTKNSYITFHGSYGKVPYNPYYIGQERKKNNSNKVPSYYLLTSGNFNQENYTYGFKLKRTSDQAYLKNYYKNYTPYLTSQLYLYNVKDYNYLSIKGLHFQGLKLNDRGKTDPLILPEIKTKNIIPLNDNMSSYFTIENNSLAYREQQKGELFKTSLTLSLTNNFLTSTGHLFYVIVRNRGDLYFLNYLYKNNIKTRKVLARNIPEFQTIWRYPLTSSLSSHSHLMIEPIISMTIGRKLTHHDNRFIFINNKYELSENNLFSTNHYNNIDYYEFGNRLNYGVNSAIILDQTYLSLFLGQSHRNKFNFNNKFVDNTENVGKISANFLSQLELFYKFYKNKDWSPIRDEIGANFYHKKLQFTTSFVQLNKLHNYYGIDVIDNKIKQFYYYVTYQLTTNWSISYNMQVDLSKKKLRVLSKAIGMTYTKDCIKITGELSDNYMKDNSRGIKKLSSIPTISIGLKILNM